MTNDIFSVINNLRSKVKDVNSAACTFNQAVKSLAGLDEKYPEVAEALGIEKFNFKSICSVWADDLHIEKDGKAAMALYMTEAAKITVTNEKGEPKEVNMYEKVTNKKGVVTFKSVKRRVLATPSAWSPALILEGLVQSTCLSLAKMEAEQAERHYNDIMSVEQEGVPYIKVTEKGADGSSVIRYEAVCE